MKIKVSEHQLQTEIMNYLKYKGWYVMRLNSGAIQATNRYGNKHMMRLAPAGTPDLMAFKKALFGVNVEDVEPIPYVGPSLYFIEVKVEGNKPTLLQTVKMQELEEYGAKCLVIHSLEELQEAGF